MTLKPTVALLSLFPSLALAQSAASTADVLARQNDDRWTIGAGVAIRDNGYAGEGARTRPFPWVQYEGSRVFWRGLGGGVHVVDGERFGVDLLVSGRFDGVDIEDLGRTELARNGVDADLLDDRDDGVDAGVAVSWRSAIGELKLSALADVTDTSGGYELAADYAHAFQWGATTWVPSVGVRWQSADLVDYYYGTLDKEVARGVLRYRPGSALLPQVGLAAQRRLGEHWKLTGALSYRFLPNELTDSPLMDQDSKGSVGLRIGIGRSF